MKIYFFLTFLTCFLTFGQSRKTAEADSLFKESRFNLAISAYSIIVKKSTNDSHYAQMKLADCYYNLYDFDEAVIWYKKVIKNNSNPDVLFRYVQMLKAQGNNYEAKKQMYLFIENNPNDSRTINYLKEESEKTEQKISNVIHEIYSMKMNTEMKETSGILYKNKFYFVSNRGREKAFKRRPNKIYTNIYVANFKSGKVLNIEEIPQLNTKLNDDAVSFSYNGKTSYTATDKMNLILLKKSISKKQLKGKKGNSVIFKSTFQPQKFWSNFEPLPFINVDYSYNDPFLSLDEKMLYFASDMPGGFGGMDLWKVSVSKDGNYGDPVNLGEKINTIEDERYPFFNEDNNEIYFSSNGHQGMGGFDVFKINLDKEDNELYHLKEPVNSKKNDYAFVYYADKNIGFFTSDRTGNDDIYHVKEKDIVEIKFNINDDETTEPINDALVIIKDHKNKEIAKIYSDSDGFARYDSPINMDLTFHVVKNGYTTEILKTNIGNNVGETKTLTFTLKPIIIKEDNSTLETNICFDLYASNITYKASIVLNQIIEILEKNPDFRISVTIHSDDRDTDDYNFNLSQSRAMSISEYLIYNGIDSNRIVSTNACSNPDEIVGNDYPTRAKQEIYSHSTFVFVKK